MKLNLSQIKVVLRLLFSYEELDTLTNTLEISHEMTAEQLVILRMLPISQVFRFLEDFENCLQEKLYKSPERNFQLRVARNRAFDALLRLGFVEPVDYLAKIYLIENSTKRDKSTFAYLMIKYGNEKAIPYLTKMLKDQSRYVKGQAAEALGYLGDKDCTAALKRCLTDHRKDSQGIPISEQANISIQKINYNLPTY